MQNLVIVESPTKSKTLQKFLGSNYRVEASMGHVRDLPKSDIGVDVEKSFEPKYIIPKDKQKRVNELKKLAVSAKTLWLATDPDREGEAIAWHLKELIGSRFMVHGKDKKTMSNELRTMNIHRVIFHEITPEAIKEAFKDPRDIDLRLVDAQQARRILDRLVGYKLSPLLWKKVKSGLSAGRVQSVALRLIVEREKEITAFKPEEYWSVTVELELRIKNENEKFSATLVELNGKKLAIKNKEEADGHVKALEKADYRVEKVTQKEMRKYPAPPFTTSTLQQTAANRLGLSAKKTMMLAQHLYEHGLITYMRTDSLNLSAQAITAARSYIEQNIGKAYLPTTARAYKTKSKVAQEAHEAIRPSNISLTAEKLKTLEGLSRDHVRLYELVWKRMMACQMSEAVLDHTSVDVEALTASKAVSYTLRATGSVIKFEGWLKLYKVSGIKYKGEESEEDEKGEQALPKVSEGQLLDLLKLLPEQHFTEGSPRYNEASLIKKLEELGIGRPSTYATILSTILDRFYVEKKEKRFFSTPLGVAVAEFLVANFPDLFDYEFTAGMEDSLDDIARGERKWQPTIEEFYRPFEKKLETVEKKAARVKIATEETDKICPDCGKPLIIRFGKFGKFLACSGFPDCKHTEGLEEKVDAICPDCGGDIVMRKTRKGRPFYGCKNWPTCKFASWTKPKGAKAGVS
ncbi:DNA topoisomerase I [Candidatus Daviesbacteria bacterium RIFCSPHIGHO2_12_FULL_43_11]|uniref:DNA topoisomerase 1 n=1 Tax=Candidatus Daviesbacteria bacterium RIFCSPHIGHO2_12_FULL_43_11 TaxID=1797780 RepID=A0A1F5K6V2_9BACT|nr:MAG: DNA topoisomerase I [Candidatus Daviesbacteria bacterium RIFCSPHIGHO2_01_FULL_43_17]OGE36672.1 MAG: DNA topoisomerase I [Candidatus Daviesbacteria bacterium RIFCSPHIGHO2_12_FULL_43_11]